MTNSTSIPAEPPALSAQQRQIHSEKVGLFATEKSTKIEHSAAEKEAAPPLSAPASSTESYKFGTARKRTVKLRSPQEALTLAIVTGLLSSGFGAISDYTLTNYQQKLARGWLRTRYWGEAITLNPPQMNDLPEWDDLPADVKHFFKLLYLLSQPGALFITIRLDPETGEKALRSARGPADWLAYKIKRALESVGIPADQIAFALEFAPGQAKTLHKLHIHGALCIPVEMLERASAALTAALAPKYKQHGTNSAVKLETPDKAGDVAKYVVKESRVTTDRIIRLLNPRHAKGANPHRAAEAATAGGRATYNNLRSSLFGKQETFNKAFHKAIQETLVNDE